MKTEKEILELARKGDQSALTHATELGRNLGGDARQALTASVYAALGEAATTGTKERMLTAKVAR